MSVNRRAAMLKMASSAYEMNLSVANGRIVQDENGRWLVGNRDLLAWLAEHEGEDAVVIMGSLMDERPVPVRTCGTCGRDYTDVQCPHCRRSRMRLRGRP